MISLKDINESQPMLKALLILLIMMPFWYAYFGAFYPEILADSDLILEISYCICLSLSAGLIYLIVPISLIGNPSNRPSLISLATTAVMAEIVAMTILFGFTLGFFSQNYKLEIIEAILIFPIPALLFSAVNFIYKFFKK